ncbi:acyl-CoA dehydrogenase [Flavisphingomonas formosensis]|uniref:acyl-CoA dehydrogenase n=1 Tax=Flavisphingomonas formosensis TaxID=861534 RepID=UPI0018DFF57B|nr:acyl-CoA dehydrogenase [Sphingomonas formosensis]
MIVDLHPTEDQRMIEESVRAFLADRLPVERLREPAHQGGAAEAAAWAELTALGLFGLGLDEARGGLGLGLAEEALVARALGLHLVSPSVVAQMIAPHLAPDDALRAALVAGETRAAFANRIGEAGGHLIDGAGASHAVLLAGGVALIGIDALGSPEPVDAIDETVRIARMLAAFPAAPRDAASDRALLLLAAYLTGIAQATRDMAVAYAITREQFGQPIGAFQAIKHMAADMATRAAAAEAQCFHAAVTFGRGLDDGIEAAAAALLAETAALANAGANIQIHGGMGFTAECDAHLYLKRAHLLASLAGGRRLHQRRLLGTAS